MSDLASTLGVDDRTARRRLAAADAFDALPAEKQEQVRTREKAKERQGERSDLNIPDNCPEPPDAGDTRDIVAAKVGFGSGKEYERAKLVAAKGSAELKAATCRDILGWDRLPAVIVHVTSLVAGEYAENEIRKDFTVSERTAIGETLEDLERAEAKERKKRKPKDSVPDNCPGQKVGEVRDIVARKVGFVSAKEYERKPPFHLSPQATFRPVLSSDPTPERRISTSKPRRISH